MKKLAALIVFAVTTNANAQLQNAVVKDQMCKDQVAMAMMLADAKANNKPSIVNPEAFRRGDPGLYELVLNMDRIAENYKGQDLQTVGKMAWAWCMDNIESIVFKHRRN